MDDGEGRVVVGAGGFDGRDAEFDGDEADGFLRCYRIAVYVWFEGRGFEVQSVEVGVV
jgi:hypothetical protein